MSIARQLDGIGNGEWPNHVAAIEQFKQRGMRGLGTKNCYPAFGQYWQVKLYVGGAQHIIGETYNGARAARFADMAIVYLAQYRKRKREVLDTDLNFSVAQAKADLEAVPRAKQMLIEFENYLLKKGLVVPLSAASGDLPAASLAQVRKDLQLFLRQYSTSFERASAVLGSVPEAKITLGMMSEHLSQMGKYNTSLDKLLSNHGTLTDEDCRKRADAIQAREAALREQLTGTREAKSGVAQESEYLSGVARMAKAVEGIQSANEDKPAKLTPEQRAAELAVDKCDYSGILSGDATGEIKLTL